MHPIDKIPHHPTTTYLLSTPTPYNLPSNNDNELVKIRNSAAYILSIAVQKLFPEAQPVIGPCIDNGFYHDFYFPPITSSNGKIHPSRTLTNADLPKIQQKMTQIIISNVPIRREEITRDQAIQKFQNQLFKLEIVASTPIDQSISMCHIGELYDLSFGPHVNSTGILSPTAISLQNAAGAYWLGDESQPMLQRIYGTAWKTRKQLTCYSFFQNEAKKRDHRTLGVKLDLFSIQEEGGGGLVFWHPKGSIIRHLLEAFWKKTHIHFGYGLLYTPHIANHNLWIKSGHFECYQDSMIPSIHIENEQYQLKPMNCPLHCLIYKSKLRSYRELPIKYAELGTVYRNERSGTLHGLMRVRGFTQDDGHIFCRMDQLEDEIENVLRMTKTLLSNFGFTSYDIQLSTRPNKSVGSNNLWQTATYALKNALERSQWNYRIDKGGGAFYGPKIDLTIQDAIGRKWQCSTIQCDFNIPQRFGLKYITEEGSTDAPILVHRAIFGSIERFIGILIENSAGEFPLWLAPTQLLLLPVTEEAQAYCYKIQSQAIMKSIRVEINLSNERLGKQILKAERNRVPLMGIIGKNEIDTGMISLRCRKEGDLGLVNASNLLNELQFCSENKCELKKKWM